MKDFFDSVKDPLELRDGQVQKMHLWEIKKQLFLFGTKTHEQQNGVQCCLTV